MCVKCFESVRCKEEGRAAFSPKSVFSRAVEGKNRSLFKVEVLRMVKDIKEA